VGWPDLAATFMVLFPSSFQEPSLVAILVNLVQIQSRAPISPRLRVALDAPQFSQKWSILSAALSCAAPLALLIWLPAVLDHSFSHSLPNYPSIFQPAFVLPLSSSASMTPYPLQTPQNNNKPHVTSRNAERNIS